MRRFYLILFCIYTFCFCALSNGVEINGIYYLLDSTNYTASVTYTGTSPILYSTYIGNIIIPDSVNYNEHDYVVNSIGDGAFQNATQVDSIWLCNSIKNIGNYAFTNCRILQFIQLPNYITTIGDNVFEECNSLKTIILPNGISRLKEMMFSGCISLTSINIPNSVTDIDNFAFDNCAALTSITIPYNVKNIGYNPFRGCYNLTSINVSSSNQKYDSRGCNAIIEKIQYKLIAGCKNTIIPNGISAIEDFAFANCSTLDSIYLPNDIKHIGNMTFSNCIGLTKIHIPAKISNIGTYCFRGCHGLTAISVDNNNVYYDSRNNCNAIIKKDNKTYSSDTLVLGCRNTIIPNNVAIIGKAAFAECTELATINIPNNIIEIGIDAFTKCTKLKSVRMSDSITSINATAFMDCPALKSITLPNCITNIGEKAFMRCTNLRTVYCKALTPPQISTDTYSQIATDATLYVPYNAMEAYNTDTNWNQAFDTIRGFVDVTIQSNTSVNFAFALITGTQMYHIKIFEDQPMTQLFKEYYIDKNGIQINNSLFQSPNHAPAIKMDTIYSTDDMVVLTIANIQQGQPYYFRIEASDSQNDIIYEDSGSFCIPLDNAIPEIRSPFSYNNISPDFYISTERLFFQSETPADVAVYNLSGTMIYSAKGVTAAKIALEKGVYIVVINGKPRCIMKD